MEGVDFGLQAPFLRVRCSSELIFYQKEQSEVLWRVCVLMTRIRMMMEDGNSKEKERERKGFFIFIFLRLLHLFFVFLDPKEDSVLICFKKLPYLTHTHGHGWGWKGGMPLVAVCCLLTLASLDSSSSFISLSLSRRLSFFSLSWTAHLNEGMIKNLVAVVVFWLSSFLNSLSNLCVEDAAIKLNELMLNSTQLSKLSY